MRATDGYPDLSGIFAIGYRLLNSLVAELSQGEISNQNSSKIMTELVGQHLMELAEPQPKLASQRLLVVGDEDSWNSVWDVARNFIQFSESNTLVQSHAVRYLAHNHRDGNI